VLQLDMVRRKAALALEAKNAEIGRFKLELEGLVHAVKLLRMQQQHEQQLA
jgi:hypothetical protein